MGVNDIIPTHNAETLFLARAMRKTPPKWGLTSEYQFDDITHIAVQRIVW